MKARNYIKLRAAPFAREMQCELQIAREARFPPAFRTTVDAAGTGATAGAAGTATAAAAVQKNNIETRSNFTQTRKFWNEEEEKHGYTDENDNASPSTPFLLFYDENKKCTNIVEEPAPQWLIEEALNRGNEVCKDYENIIFDLKNKLNETKVELEEAIRKKNFVKEKYKRIAENLQMEACKKNDVLQKRIIQICTLVLEKLRSSTLSNNKGNRFQNNNRRSSRYFGKLSKRLYKKLRVAISTSKKLKNELSKTRKELKDKSNDYESVNKCFTIFKKEMETTESNLNDLINENAFLRKKFEDMKEWMELKIGKEQNEKISVTQMRELPKYRELANLKKKSEEDCATIKQLHNKLLRSESANANKGFLLNSYKGQISDLAKEKDLFTSKIKELENELTALRTSNAQLKAKISLINEEKLNLACKMEKSETDLKEQIESQINRKHEESMQKEINAIKMKCEDAIKVLKEKLITFESKNIEYSKAIKEFLKKIHDHCDQQVNGKTNFYEDEASEREAHETACNILNMTPEELTNFMNEKPNAVNNTWPADLNKITSKRSFSDDLAKFLFKTTFDKIYTSA
ncbi:putative leucine-rich repeat-containing protein DDB_G0290503 [Vespa crabro]|uniref:putative leucine-rich repeat-containing protein DDB_G0290503 n=1 Tax=Vespa crabro TaxID=7445 RepID=UPI001EFF787C|nr:putative leucine-rich repeat-containing protein DDB_G0290503 [Vespa crabro]